MTLETNLEGMSRPKFLNVAQERLKSDGEMAVKWLCKTEKNYWRRLKGENKKSAQDIP
jgi:hypothetical protein